MSAHNPGMAKDPYKVEVGERLALTARANGITEWTDLARAVGGERAQVSAWINGVALPPVPAMKKLLSLWGITLDWLYTGDETGLTRGAWIRLHAAQGGESPPAAAAQAHLPMMGAAPPAARRGQKAKAATYA